MQILEKERAKYRRRAAETKICPFCDPLILKAQACPSLQSQYWQVIINKYPYLDGNLMLVPKRHVETLEKLTPEEQADFFPALQKAKQALSLIFKTNDFNIALNIGKKSGASLKHLHWQIVPRAKKIENSLNIFADLHVITVSPPQLKKLINQLKLS